jgi:hypothetical protein
LLYPLADSATAAFGFMVVAIFGSNMGYAFVASAIQRMFQASMLGPTAVAAITDYVLEDAGMIRYSLASVGGVSRALAFVLILAGLRANRILVRERDRQLHAACAC